MARPTLKRSVPYFIADGSVHFRLSGELISLEDPDGRVAALLGLLDGSRETDDLWRGLSASYPDVTQADIREAVRDLDADHLIHDAADTGADFDEAAKERWSNNFGFFETYASLGTSKFQFQRRIRDCRVAVLGVGGVGTHALIDLVAIGFTDIRIVDFDTIALSNLNRQILYDESTIGRAKVDIAAQRAMALNSALRLDTAKVKLLSGADVYRVVHDRDIVIGSVDGPKMQVVHWLNEGCVRAGAALITGGVDAQRAVHYTVVPGVSGCVECWYTTVRETDPTSRLVQDVMTGMSDRGEEFGEDTAAFNGLVLAEVTYIVSEVIRLASQVSTPLSVGRVLESTFHDPRLREVESFRRRADCLACRDARPRPALEWLAAGPVQVPF